MSMDNKSFNPFEDRLSRDLRNKLSEGLVRATETGDKENLDQTVAYYRKQNLASHYKRYLDNRVAKYDVALHTIKEFPDDPIKQALVLWNLKLFFEVHEVLEHAWYHATGEKKRTLQALIRAAGVYIKAEYNNLDSAKRIAAKAIPVLLANEALLKGYCNVTTLTNALQNPDEDPPKLSI